MIRSSSAHSLSLIFSRFFLEPGVELYVSYGDGGKVVGPAGKVVGPFTHLNVKPHGRFAIAPLATNELMLELYVPADCIRTELHLATVAHGYRPTMVRSGPCNINVACERGIDQQSRSVAMLLTSSGQAFCSGAMLNNVKEDGRQLLLTALHCLNASATEDSLLMFNYQAPRCNDTQATMAPTSMTAHGLKKLGMSNVMSICSTHRSTAQWKQSDFSLLELEEEIPKSYNVFLSGWTAEDSVVPAQPFGIHHPSGDIKKVSLHHGNGIDACWGWCELNRDPADHWQISRWNKGTTEPGSSGSPLFDGLTKRIVGQLHGGSASCHQKNGYDLYGKFAYSFDKSGDARQNLKTVLDPKSKGARFLDGVNLNDVRRPLPRFLRQKW